MAQFTYLGAIEANQTSVHKEVKSTFNSGNIPPPFI
jgi:hypothetical protein